MTLSWGNWDVRVYAAEAWVSLAPRFAVAHPIIVDQVEAVLADPAPAVRLQAARNLQVICVAAPERMWTMGELVATQEHDLDILASYLESMRRFSHSDPARCEAVLSIIKTRVDGGLSGDEQAGSHVRESIGGWTAQLYAGQGRPLTRTWLMEWAGDPVRYGDLLDAFTSSLREAFFQRYAPNARAEDREMCDRSQDGLALILTSTIRVSAEAYRVLASDSGEDEKLEARKRYTAAEKVTHHAMNQLYFGSGAYTGNTDSKPGLPDAAAMERFLTDYADILALLRSVREPATLHHLVQVYEFLIPGDPIGVFDAIHAILLGRGEEEGYHHESLGNAAVVRIVQRYIADHRALFEDDGRRARLVAILRLFSDIGWPEALRLLYDLPDLLR